MTRFLHQPSLPIGSTAVAFVQTVTMVDGSKTIGSARWHCRGDDAGIVQVLDLTISDDHRREGNGKRLLAEVIWQARQLHQGRGIILRRVWMGLEQKTQIIGRAFLTSAGFHHIAAMNGLYADQELMIYVKSMD